MSAAGKEHIDIDANMLATMDRMEKKLKKYRLDTSTPQSDKYTETKIRDNPTHWSYDMFDEEELRADNTLSFTGKKAQVHVGADFDTHKPRYPSQYAYESEGVRPKVHFADSSYGKSTECDNMFRSNMAYRATNSQRSPEPDAHRNHVGAKFQTETSRTDREQNNH